MDILELMARTRRPLAAMTIARRCEIPRSSTYHLLAAMRQRGYINYDPEAGRWTLGHRLAELGGHDPPSVDVLAVLDAFDARNPRLGSAELARRTGMVVPTVDRALEILTEAQLVTPHSGGSYSLGLHIAALAARLPEIELLRSVARPRLVELRDATEETANLLIKSGDHVIYLDQVESDHALRHTGWAGRSIPLGPSAAGRALADQTQVHVVSDAIEAGVTAVARAIDVNIEEPVAISVTGPTARLQGAGIDVSRSAIDDAARNISADLQPAS